MLKRIADRRAEVMRQETLFTEKAASPGAPASASMSSQPAVSSQPAIQDQAEARANTDAARVRFEAMQESLKGFLATQTRAFGVVQAEQAKADSWLSKPDVTAIAAALNELRDTVYPAWDSAYAAAVDAARTAGLAEPKEPEVPKPARSWWQHLHDISFKGW